MGGIEEIPDDSGTCPVCGKIATHKCTGCDKGIYYCNRNCQKKDWKTHKPLCKKMPYKVINHILIKFILFLNVVFMVILLPRLPMTPCSGTTWWPTRASRRGR